MNKLSVDIRTLAKLARLEVTDAEVAALEKELPEILSFVEAIQKVEVEPDLVEDHLRNVMREDTGAHESGIHTEDLLAAAPATIKNRIVVKQVVSRKKAQ